MAFALTTKPHNGAQVGRLRVGGALRPPNPYWSVIAVQRLRHPVLALARHRRTGSTRDAAQLAPR